jgi:branched-chain amino acid transport system ATP-binding protein
VTGLPPERIAALGMARSFQISSLFPNLTAVEHVQLALQSGTSAGWQFWRSDKVLRRWTEPAHAHLAEVGLADAAQTLAAALPYGRKRALELAVALARQPRLLLLDEPTAGMGMEDIDRTVALIERIRAGRTIVLVEHNMSVVGRLADRVTVLQSGRVLVEGGYHEIRTDERVIAAYLGSADAHR